MVRLSRMPGTIKEGDVLLKRTISGDHQVTGHVYSLKAVELGIDGTIELVTEQLLYVAIVEVPLGQADAVNNYQTDLICWSGISVFTGKLPCAQQTTVCYMQVTPLPRQSVQRRVSISYSTPGWPATV